MKENSAAEQEEVVKTEMIRAHITSGATTQKKKSTTEQNPDQNIEYRYKLDEDKRQQDFHISTRKCNERRQLLCC